MSKFTNDDLKRSIKDSLKLDSRNNNSLNESYVAQQKQFNLPTELLSEANKNNHLELYHQYVKNFNRISAELDTVDRKSASSDFSDYRSLKIDETYNLNGVYLHELYFANISDLHSQISMDSISYMRLARDFGSFDEWQDDFIACCLSNQCGWAITYYSIYLKSYVNCFVDLHSLNVPFGTYPVIVMDTWQHAYYRDYLKDVKTYTYGMMKQLNWNIIEKRFNKAEKIAEAIRG
jgi:Fe-Mn family superoxide dismutase